MKILFLGDSPLGGASTYLYCVLHYLKHHVTHIPPGKKLTPTKLRQTNPDLIIISDYSYQDLKEAETLIKIQVEKKGAGLLMVGGWGSFFGGSYKGSKIEKMLPVTIIPKDDRLNYSPGLKLSTNLKHPILKDLNFEIGPTICGLNIFKPKTKTKTILIAQPISFKKKGNITLKKEKKYPSLVLGECGKGKTAAFATDFAPHWTGGLLDWGKKRVKIQVKSKGIGIEVGECYIKLINNIVKKLTSHA